MSGYLTDSISSTGSRTTFTISAWVKVNGATANQTIFGAGTAGSNSGKFYFAISNGQVRIGGGANVYRVSTRLFRDPASWYHLVCAFDTTQGSDGNRIKFYVNGESYTDFSAGYNTIPSNQNTPVNESGKINTFGAEQGGGESWDGYMTHMVLVDGAQLTASNFGETDSTTGEWKPKADPTGVTYGTNGVFMKCENSGNFGLDSSGNSNNYTANSFPTGAHTTDCASNNFCTLSPLSEGADATLTKGNLEISYANNTRTCSTANMGVDSGKWYWEFKVTAISASPNPVMVGIGELPYGPDLGTYLGQNASGWGYAGEDGTVYNSGSGSAYGATYTTGDIIGVAFDADNGNLYFYKNGTIQNSGTAAATGLTSSSTGFYYPAVGKSSGVRTFTAQANFGNPPFTIASGNADANGFGNFEYAVPSGYYALCTNNINSYG
jgi:hypothetical protein